MVKSKHGKDKEVILSLETLENTKNKSQQFQKTHQKPNG